jgi:pimeloyl-ACP methyl ester carboxylesterase
MAPVARELSSDWAVIEPIQTAVSVEGQLSELHEAIVKNAVLPVALVGSSWGAMLGFMYAARFPKTVRKLILVGSGPFEQRYAQPIIKTRLDRLQDAERRHAESLLELLSSESAHKHALFEQLAAIFTKTDSYDPKVDLEIIETQYDLHISVWQEAAAMRRSGQLLEMGKVIACPVVAIHGDYDPHPIEGIRKPLQSVLQDFRVFVLEKCGHYPWIEQHAREGFFEILRQELRYSRSD